MNDLETGDGHADRRRELLARTIALPAALSTARIAVGIVPGPVRLITMWVHESGHAVAAWLCGYSAWPGPWFTPMATTRSLLLTTIVIGALLIAAARQWTTSHRGWTALALGTVLLVCWCTCLLRPGQAQQFITFAGDGGCFALGAALMLTMYVDADHPIRREGLRWAFVVIGALAFMDAFVVWSGAMDALPFGENENGLSDPTVLTEVYGWTVLALIGRYALLARACLGALGVVYVAGLAASMSALRQPANVEV